MKGASPLVFFLYIWRTLGNNRRLPYAAKNGKTVKPFTTMASIIVVYRYNKKKYNNKILRENMWYNNMGIK